MTNLSYSEEVALGLTQPTQRTEPLLVTQLIRKWGRYPRQRDKKFRNRHLPSTRGSKRKDHRSKTSISNPHQQSKLNRTYHEQGQ